MTGLRLILAVLFTLPAFGGAAVADDIDAARAATRRASGNIAATTGARNRVQTPTANLTNRTAIIGTPAPATDTTTRTGVVARDTARSTTTTTPSTSARTTSNVMPRAIATGNTVTTPGRVATTTPRINTTRATRTNTEYARAARTGARISRSATTTETKLTATDVINHDASKCRTIYYECMDEFCANKDAQLKRCACSSRINEFDGTKKNLAAVDEKLLDFNQRLLTVNMDKEDAAALFQETEGERAFNQTDKSESKKLLDQIAKKLNTSFDTSNFDQNLSPISLSLNMAAAFDNVDSLRGSGTTSKSGTALYAAALPVCREMALEVCSPSELDIVEGGYQMLIEQDCTTVSKNYATQVDTARERVREGGALLDMSRLDIHQKRNSDDILTCKTKMLDMLTDRTVCGENLGQCLDTTGRYIDPSTGQAFLTMSLADLGSLITRPDAGQTWTTTPGNEAFVYYLNSKKKFLVPAMEQCQDISDYVWDAFVEDALAQIKLAQDAKLEEMRQACTTLTTQCLSDANDSITDFDARALSIFGVDADRTINAMCADVRDACTALLNTTDTDRDWIGGMTEIATNRTYETILTTCREVGRACIIQACKSVSGNFALCESIDTSINRKSIINRSACWPEVMACVASAGPDVIDRIFTDLANDGIVVDGTFHKNMYGTGVSVVNAGAATAAPDTDTTTDAAANTVYDICAADQICATNPDLTECRVCRLAEKIWGNCEFAPTKKLTADNTHNKIKTLVSANEDTLLSWFAKNTKTLDAADSCRDTSCGVGYTNMNGQCIPESNFDSTGRFCPIGQYTRITTANGNNNCCAFSNDVAGYIDAWGNCCERETRPVTDLPTINGDVTKGTGGVCMPAGANTGTLVTTIDSPTDDTFYDGERYHIICTGTIDTSTQNVSQSDINDGFPSGRTIRCNGDLILVDKNGRYTAPLFDNATAVSPRNPWNYYYPVNKTNNGTIDPVYKINTHTGGWQWQDTSSNIHDAPSHALISYEDELYSPPVTETRPSVGTDDDIWE